MLFQYKCQSCEHIFDKDFRIGQADAEVPCEECKKVAKRFYGSMSFVLKGPGWPGRTGTMNREMTKRNEAAGKRMRKEHTPMKTVAYDYGNGDVRECRQVERAAGTARLKLANSQPEIAIADSISFSQNTLLDEKRKQDPRVM